jgi:hypothetical protein
MNDKKIKLSWDGTGLLLPENVKVKAIKWSAQVALGIDRTPLVKWDGLEFDIDNRFAIDDGYLDYEENKP